MENSWSSSWQLMGEVGEGGGEGEGGYTDGGDYCSVHWCSWKQLWFKLEWHSTIKAVLVVWLRHNLPEESAVIKEMVDKADDGRMSQTRE